MLQALAACGWDALAARVRVGIEPRCEQGCGRPCKRGARVCCVKCGDGGPGHTEWCDKKERERKRPAPAGGAAMRAALSARGRA